MADSTNKEKFYMTMGVAAGSIGTIAVYPLLHSYEWGIAWAVLLVVATRYALKS